MSEQPDPVATPAEPPADAASEPAAAAPDAAAGTDASSGKPGLPEAGADPAEPASPVAPLTAAEPVEPVAVAAPVTPVLPNAPRRRGRRIALALLALLVPILLVAAAAGGLAAWDAQYEARVLPGVRVGSVDLSGLDRDAARAALATAYPYGEGRIILRAPDGDLAIPYADVDRRPDLDALVDEALAAGRTVQLPERLVVQVRQALEGTAMEPRVLVDDAAIAATITAALATLERAPVDATIAVTPDGFATTPARAGQAVDPTPAIATAAGALARTDAPAELVIDIAPVALAPAVDDAAVAEARSRAERVIGDLRVTWRDRDWTIRAARVRSWLRFGTLADGTPTPEIDTTLVPDALRRPTKAVRKDPVNALFLKGERGRVVGVVASKDGRELDLDTTVARIATELQGRALGTPAASVAVATAKVQPKLTTEEARKTAPVMERLGKWTTYFPISDRNYFGANIWRPAEIIDGTVLSPGEKFDWWAAIWPVTPARGFGPGGFIRGSYTDPTGALGGGMCSSSTTLFNAALRAGLQMGARSNHKYYISRYPLGLDATVSVTGGRISQNMTFWNDMDHPVVIRAFKIRKGSAGYVRYEIWGIPDGRTVSLTKPAVSNVRKATTNVVEVDTLPPGVREQVEYAADGMDVSVTRIVRDANGRIIHRNTWRTHYVLWNGRIEVGRR